MDLFKQIEKSLSEIEKLFDERSLYEFINSSYDDLYKYHFGLGTLIRNNILIDNSGLFVVFENCGLHRKDDMSLIVIQWFYIYIRTKYKQS